MELAGELVERGPAALEDLEGDFVEEGGDVAPAIVEVGGEDLLRFGERDVIAEAASEANAATHENTALPLHGDENSIVIEGSENSTDTGGPGLGCVRSHSASVESSGWTDGEGAPELSGAVFEAGYQVGCGIDISGGIDAEIAGALGSSPALKAGVEGGPSVSVKLPNVQGVNAGIDGTAKVEGSVSGKAEMAPTVSAHLNPGGITNVVLVSMPMDPQYLRASGGFSGAQVKVEGCIGPVTVRSFATVSTTSPTSVDTVSVYGDPQRIR